MPVATISPPERGAARVSVTLRITPELYELVKQRSDREERTVNNWIARLIRDTLTNSQSS